MTYLSVRGLKKYFTTPNGLLHAVDNVSFDLDQGQTLGIVGESGCGKSTLGRCLTRLHEPTAGTVDFQGNRLSDLSKRGFKPWRKQIQMIFQDPYSSLNPRKTVGATIAEPLIIHNLASKSQTEQKVKELMELVGLSPSLYDHHPHELDGGRRQRVGIARALALSPSLIICDEPVSALDVSVQAQVLNLMKDLQEQKKLSYLFITHNMAVVRHISDHILVMYMGVAVEKASSNDIFHHSSHPYTQALLKAVPIPDLNAPKFEMTLQGEITSPINPAPGCRFRPRCPHAFEKCNHQAPVLHEIAPEHHVACHLYS